MRQEAGSSMRQGPAVTLFILAIPLDPMCRDHAVAVKAREKILAGDRLDEVIGPHAGAAGAYVGLAGIDNAILVNRQDHVADIRIRVGGLHNKINPIPVIDAQIGVHPDGAFQLIFLEVGQIKNGNFHRRRFRFDRFQESRGFADPLLADILIDVGADVLRVDGAGHQERRA